MSLFLTSPAGPLLACAACFGQSDSAMAQGMNWGILSLLGIIALVLVGVATFFVYLAKRTSALAAATSAETMLRPTPPSAG